jgi:hypothetical protein
MDELEAAIRERVQVDEEKRVAEGLVPTSILRSLLSLLDKERERTARLEEALRRIKNHVGRGAADIVVANTVLGRIDQEARAALESESRV